MNNLQATFKVISEDSLSKIQESLSLLELNDEKEERRFRVVASTEDVDRSWEVIKLDGWTWENFMKNPVIIANHVYKIENIVGKATEIYVKDNQLVIEWIFSSTNPLGVLLADLYDEGMIKSVSVWFIPKARDEQDNKIITEAELLELSFVAVPCNPNALSLDQKHLLEETWMIEEMTSENKENEEVWSSSFYENCCGDGGVNDSTDESIIVNSSEITNKDVVNILSDIKWLLELLVEDKIKRINDSQLIAEETLECASRAINEWLEKYKKALRT